MSAAIYVIGISVVAAILFWAVNNIEPNRRYASVLKFLIVFVSVAAITGRLGIH
jgi:ABC-type phosphate/phosphonate transport system permease subunit